MMEIHDDYQFISDNTLTMGFIGYGEENSGATFLTKIVLILVCNMTWFWGNFILY